jgi:hypothetical protein
MVQWYQLKSCNTDLKVHYKTAYNLYITLSNELIRGGGGGGGDTAIIGATHTQGSAYQTSD